MTSTASSATPRTLNICEPLGEPGLQELLALGATVRWPRGDMVFRTGDRQGAFFKITKGIVAVSSTLHDGRRPILALLTTLLILNINRDQVADYLGLTVDTVSRSFKALKSRKIIAGNGRSGIAILDARKLRSIAMEEGQATTAGAR